MINSRNLIYTNILDLTDNVVPSVTVSLLGDVEFPCQST